MKLKFMIFVMALAAMGPAQDAAPPDPETIRDGGTQRNSARLPPVAQPQPEAAEPAPAVAVRTVEVLDADAVQPEDFRWIARPIVVFSDTPDDPAFRKQVEELRRDTGALAARDAVVILDSDPSSNSIWRQQFRPQGFSLILIDKDGQVKIRRPSPWDIREIGRAIDRLPLRRQEIGRGSLLR